MANQPRDNYERRTEMLRIKATPSEKQLIRLVAQTTGTTESDFMRNAIQAALAQVYIPSLESA